MIALALQYIPGELWAALAGLVAVLGVWLTGRRGGAVAEKTKAAARNADAYRKTTEKMENADTGNPDGSDDAIWLRDRGKR